MAHPRAPQSPLQEEVGCGVIDVRDPTWPSRWWCQDQASVQDTEKVFIWKIRWANYAWGQAHLVP